MPAVVISDNADSAALRKAAARGLPAVHIGGTMVRDERERDRRLAGALSEYGVGLVVLAVYLKKIGPRVLARYPSRILNIHPALLPKFGGRGMYGRRVHAAVLAAGERETGATVHFVDEDYDTGRILARRKVPVLADDTVDSLAARVLAVEHGLYVKAIEKLIDELGKCEEKHR